MTPVWLIEADVFGDSFEPLKAEARRQGMVWDIVQPRAFLNGLAPVVAGRRLAAGDCVVLSSTFPLMRHAQLYCGWVPGGWCTAGHFDCAHYYPHFPRHLLNRDHAILTIDDALARAEELFDRFGRDGEVFARPCGVQKTFTGRCVDRDAFVRALEFARYAGEPVLVAVPREVAREWRVVVARGRFVAASQYKDDGRHAEEAGCPPAVRGYVERLLADVPFRPDPVFVLDVCDADGGLHLLELNSFSCSGLYRCDPAAVVTEVKGLAVEAWQAAAAG